MRFAGSRAAGEDDIALLGDEAAAGKIARQSFVDGRAVEVEVVDVLRDRFENRLTGVSSEAGL
jgi:hypothetical protein